MTATTILAHRGASAYRPENTMDAIVLAMEQGADGIELDVHLTKDGQIVVAHDASLERVSNGEGLIHDHRLAELLAYDFNQQFPGQPPCRIPTLEEVYILIKETKLMVNVELKTTELPYPELPLQLCKLERDYSMGGRVLYSSFNHYSLMELQRINPEARIGLLYAMGMVDPWVYAKYVSAHAIHPHHAVITAMPETVARCHENGIAVNVWTVDDAETLKAMFRCGVDMVITNKPDIAISCRETIQKEQRNDRR